MLGALEILWRSALAFAVLFMFTRIMGKRQISQLTFFEYTTGITIGSIASEMCTQTNEPFYEELIAMAVFAGLTLLLSIITGKSIRARRFLNSVPTILIDNGEIVAENMKKTHFDINDLTSEARLAGYFNLSDVMYAVLETNGKVSFLPKSSKRPLNPQDMSVTVTQEGLCANVIIDGRVLENNLKSIGKDENWLYKKLSGKNTAGILLATVDESDRLTVFTNDREARKYNLFE